MASGGERTRRRLSFELSEDNREDRKCKLCKSLHSQLSKPAQWKNELARSSAASLQLGMDSLVCRPCRYDISRVVTLPRYVPRWERLRKTCYIATCCEEVFASISTKVANQAEIQTAMETTGLAISEDIPVPTPLCKHHYHTIYNILQPSQTHCVTCGLPLKGHNPRSCPKPELIEQHLKENTGFQGCINPGDKVCYTCYKSHTITLQQSKTISTDRDLKALIATCIEDIPSSDNIHTLEDIANTAIAKTVISVGESLLKRQVLLLPNVHDTFCMYASKLISIKKLNGEQDVEKLITSHHLLSHLQSNLLHHLAYSCRVRKHGTLLFRPNSNLLTPLSQAL